MLNKIDMLFDNGLRICDIQITRVIDCYGEKEKISSLSGNYPTAQHSEGIKGIENTNSASWLMCKHAQMKRTNFRDIKEVKKLFAGMYCIYERSLKHNEEIDTYELNFVTKTKTENGVETREVVALELIATADFGNKTFNFRDTKVEKEEDDETEDDEKEEETEEEEEEDIELDVDYSI